MAKTLQEALLEVQEDLKRIGLEVKGQGGHRRSRRKRRGRRSSASAGAPKQETGRLAQTS